MSFAFSLPPNGILRLHFKRFPIKISHLKYSFNFLYTIFKVSENIGEIVIPHFSSTQLQLITFCSFFLLLNFSHVFYTWGYRLLLVEVHHMQTLFLWLMHMVQSYQSAANLFIFLHEVYLYEQIRSTKKPGIMTNYGYVKQNFWSLQNRYNWNRVLWQE